MRLRARKSNASGLRPVEPKAGLIAGWLIGGTDCGDDARRPASAWVRTVQWVHQGDHGEAARVDRADYRLPRPVTLYTQQLAALGLEADRSCGGRGQRRGFGAPPATRACRLA